VTVPTQRFVTVYQVEATNDEELEDASEGLREALAAGITDLPPSLDFASMSSMYLLRWQGTEVGDGGSGGSG